MDDKHHDITNDKAEDSPCSGPNLTRRALLGGAVGFALGASGLLVPERLIEEAEAERHPVRNIQHRTAQRRKKRHNAGDHQQHNRRDKNDKRGSKGFRTIEFHVEIAGSRAVKVNSYWWDLDITYFGADLRLIESKTLTPGSKAVFNVTDLGSLWIDDRYYLEGNNPDFFDEVKLLMGYNGKVEQKTGWTGGTMAFKEEMPVGRITPAMVIDGFSTQVTRLDNTFSNVVFKVVASAP